MIVAQAFNFPTWRCAKCRAHVPWKDAILDVPNGALANVWCSKCVEELSMLIAEAEQKPCKWCQEPIVWCFVEQSKRRVPINPAIVADGNCVQVLRDGKTPGLRFLTRDELVSRQGARYQSHMTVCKERERALAELEAQKASKA